MEILDQITGSSARSYLLTFFAKPGQKEISFNDLQKELKINPRQLTLQLRKLKEIQFVLEKSVGNKKFYRANESAFYFSALQNFLKSFEHQDEWFRWERAATIHHISMVAQAAMAPMQPYFGICFPLTLMIYTGENVLWCNRISEMAERGQFLIDFYRQRKNAERYEKDIVEMTKSLEKVLQKVADVGLKSSKNNQKSALEKMSDRNLFALYEQLRTVYTQWYMLLWTTELVAIRCEQILKERLPEISPTDISKLAALTKKSFSQEMEDDLNALVVLARAKKSNFQDKILYRQIQKFQQKYFWMYNNYFDTRVVQVEEIILTIKKRLGTNQKSIGYHDISRKEKDALFKKLKLDAETKEIISIAEQFTYWQDFRKKWIMIFAHYLELVLAQIGTRVGLSIREMRYTLPEEIEKLLIKKERVDLLPRQKNCLIIFEPGEVYGKLMFGEKALEEEKKIFGTLNRVIPEQPLLKGNIACSGKAIGVVKVLMNPAESYKVNHGDVLVTSMTSPDFMAAIRKSVAIVTNEGGITCHAAVISRELNIPCIVGTKNATQILKDGDKVEIDAEKGIVSKLL